MNTMAEICLLAMLCTNVHVFHCFLVIEGSWSFSKTQAVRVLAHQIETDQSSLYFIFYPSHLFPCQNASNGQRAERALIVPHNEVWLGEAAFLISLQKNALRGWHKASLDTHENHLWSHFAKHHDSAIFWWYKTWFVSECVWSKWGIVLMHLIWILWQCRNLIWVKQMTWIENAFNHLLEWEVTHDIQMGQSLPILKSCYHSTLHTSQQMCLW